MFLFSFSGAESPLPAPPVPLLVEAGSSAKSLLLTYFLKPFKGSGYYNFSGDPGPESNEAYRSCHTIFRDPSKLKEEAVCLVKQLLDAAQPGEIHNGSLFVVLLRDLLFSDELRQGIGLFRAETTDTFLKIFPSGNSASVSSDQGINIHKLDRGCLIINTESESGYIVSLVETTPGRNGPASWKESFLRLQPRKDEFHHTSAVMSLCKKFVNEKLPEQFNVSKADQADILNRSAQFLKSHDQFEMENFTEEVLRSPKVAEVFREYNREMQIENGEEIPSSFQLSGEAIKKNAKFLRSVIKLDRNFHVYIHGSRDRVEKGFDETKELQYYKLYFKEEQ